MSSGTVQVKDAAPERVLNAMRPGFAGWPGVSVPASARYSGRQRVRASGHSASSRTAAMVVAVLVYFQAHTARGRGAVQHIAKELQLLGQRGFGVEGRPLAAAVGVEPGVIEPPCANARIEPRLCRLLSEKLPRTCSSKPIRCFTTTGSLRAASTHGENYSETQSTATVLADVMINDIDRTARNAVDRSYLTQRIKAALSRLTRQPYPFRNTSRNLPICT